MARFRRWNASFEVMEQRLSLSVGSDVTLGVVADVAPVSAPVQDPGGPLDPPIPPLDPIDPVGPGPIGPPTN